MKEKLINKLVAGALVFASVLPLAGSMPVHAAETQTKARWVLDGGKWYYYDENGQMEKNTTITVDGEQYNLGSDGAWIETAQQKKDREERAAKYEAKIKAYDAKYPLTNEYSEDYKKRDDRWTNKDGNWYYNSKYAQLVFGAIDNVAEDNVKDDWEKINGFWYHFNKDGVMEKNTTIKDEVGNDCVLNGDGVLTNREEPGFSDDIYTGEE